MVGPGCFLSRPTKTQSPQNGEKMGEKRGKVCVGQLDKIALPHPSTNFLSFSSFCFTLFFGINLFFLFALTFYIGFGFRVLISHFCLFLLFLFFLSVSFFFFFSHLFWILFGICLVYKKIKILRCPYKIF